MNDGAVERRVAITYFRSAMNARTVPYILVGSACQVSAIVQAGVRRRDNTGMRCVFR